MPWKECNRMTEREKFVRRLEDGERMSDLCREFEISRKTGYKIWKRYQENGTDGLIDESKVPYRNPRKTSEHVENKILTLKEERPTWGAEKLREYLIRKHAGFRFPTRNTFHNILLRHNWVKRRRRKRYKAQGTNLNPSQHPNDLWCADYKGEFRLGNQKYCYPLTISDHESRYLLGIQAMESTKAGGAFSVFEEVFQTYGLPKAIRTDNGNPFSSGKALLGLSQLSVWWLRLGIEIERIEPGHPQQNGRHERMHFTLKQECTKPPATTILQQQEKFDAFVHDYNHIRPHQSLNQKTPHECYTASSKSYLKKLDDLTYPMCDKEKKVHIGGKIIFKHKQSCFISEVLAGQVLGLKEIEDKIWRVLFMNFVIGHYDEQDNKFSSMTEFVKIENPYAEV